MNIRRVIECAREICSDDVVVLRASIFNNRGIADRTGVSQKIGSKPLKVVNVLGGKSSILSKVQSSTKHNIYWQNLILAENPDLAKECGEDFDGHETFCWIEEYEVKDRPYYEITCISKTFCGARFAVCKELMHIATDSAKGVKGANALLKCAMKWRSSIADDDKELDSETACFYLAIEVMLPWQLRSDQFMAVKKKYEESSERNMMLAKSFMIPEKVIAHICDEGVLSQDMSYCGFSYKVNSEQTS